MGRPVLGELVGCRPGVEPSRILAWEMSSALVLLGARMDEAEAWTAQNSRSWHAWSPREGGLHFAPGEGKLQQCDCAVPQQKCPAQSHSGLATRRVGTSEVHSCLRLWRPCEALSQGRNIVLARITSLRMKRNLPSVKPSNHPTADGALIPVMTKCTVGGPISQADRGVKKELADLTS